MTGTLTAEDASYATLRGLILEGAFPAGRFLSQRMLAQRVGSTVIPVRGALRRLEADGLIESVPRWGVRIPDETSERVRDRYFMREVLEAAACRLIRARGRADDRARLLRQATVVDDVSRTHPGDQQRFADAHAAFHGLLAELSGSALLQAAAERLNLRMLMAHNAERAWGRGIDDEGTPHVDLVSALFAADEAVAMAALAEHIRRGLEAELAVLDGRP